MLEWHAPREPMHPFSCATLQPTCLPVIRIYESIDEPIVTIMLNETVIQV